MKIAIVRNRIKVPVQDDIDTAFNWLRGKLGIDFEITYFDTDQEVIKKMFIPNHTNGLAAYGTENGKAIARSVVSPGFDICMFMYGEDNIYFPDGYITSWTHWDGLYPGKTEFISLITHPLNDQSEWIWKSITHEIYHAIGNIIRRKHFVMDVMDSMLVNGVQTPYYKNSEPDALDGNYAAQLELFKPYLSELMPQQYKWFKMTESTGPGHTVAELKPELVKILDDAREIAGIPFKISNGFRTPAENASIAGSAKNSAHLRGMAADLSCRDNQKRCKMLWGLMQFRDKLFIEVAGGHIHVDIDSSIHPLGSVMWGDDKD